jgi:hypothetical protein
MEIKDILSQLGLDLSNPEVKRGAIEAIEAILASRAPDTGGGSAGGGASGGENEVEIDPDLLQPSVKQAPTEDGDEDIEIEDEEDILSQVKRKDSEDPIEPNNSGSDTSGSNQSGSDQDSNDDQSDDTISTNSKDDNQAQPDLAKTKSDDEIEDSTEDEDELDDYGDDQSTSGGSSNGTDGDSDNFDNDGDDAEATEDSDSDSDSEFGDDGDGDAGSESDENGDSVNDFNDIDDFDDAELSGDNNDDSDDESNKESDEDDEFDFDEDDLLDDEIKDSAEDEEAKIKNNARKIKRERTLASARKALEAARAKNVAAALITELEKSIEALEALTEAVNKSIADISDAEFNKLINRVLDAIDACGDSGLTYTSDEEREAKVQAIKTDLAKAETQNELSAEDAAKIRAETQAIKAREKEAAKYAPKSRDSFKGFKEFLDSLTKAVSRQVTNTQVRDNTWAAINRKYNGTGVLRPGKQVKNLPNTKIPVIDFYFDCSSSWTQNDIEIGKKAVAALADLEAKGQIKVNLFYFADNVSTVYNEVAGGWTAAWNHIVKNIIATQATNVVIMTDSDMESQGSYGAGYKGFLKHTVPGYVWYLWKRGSNAPRLPRDLTGRKGVQQFSFNSSDL